MKSKRVVAGMFSMLFALAVPFQAMAAEPAAEASSVDGGIYLDEENSTTYNIWNADHDIRVKVAEQGVTMEESELTADELAALGLSSADEAVVACRLSLQNSSGTQDLEIKFYLGVDYAFHNFKVYGMMDGNVSMSTWGVTADSDGVVTIRADRLGTFALVENG